jgi:hypothetical protein
MWYLLSESRLTFATNRFICVLYIKCVSKCDVHMYLIRIEWNTMYKCSWDFMFNTIEWQASVVEVPLVESRLHCNGNSIYVFLFWELRGLSPNFHIHVSVNDLYIPRIGPHISSSRKADPSWEYIIHSQTHECGNWDWSPDISFLGIFFSNFRHFVFAVCMSTSLELAGSGDFFLCSKLMMNITSLDKAT